MNIKCKSLLTLAVLCSATFAQEPVPAVDQAVNTPVDVPSAGIDDSVPAELTPAAESAFVDAAPAEIAAPVTESAPADVAPVETAAASTALEDEVAPQAVRNGKSISTSQPPAAETPRKNSKVVYETVYMGVDGIPVRTVYVAENSPADSAKMSEMMAQFPMEFKLGVQASVNSYYLSNSESGYDWYESFDGLSWRAGVVAIIPLNQTSMGVKVGVLYEQSNASESYYVNKVPTTFKFEQKKLDVPVLFTFKAPGSRMYFDLGAQVSIPLQDELKVSFTDPDADKKVKSNIDMIDEDFRNSIDWSIVCGFSIMANKYISLDLRAELGLSETYEGYIDFLDLGLNSSSFGIGLTVYPF